ncbi:MAG: polysaccharide biosynthesis protein, partial [Pseudomonadota bacterium]
MLYRFIDHMPRVAKQLIVLSVDATLVVITLYAAFALRFGDWLPWVLVNESWKLLPIIAMFSGAVSIILRIPRIKLSSFGEHTIPVMGVFAGSLALATIVVTYVLGLSAPRSVPLIFGVLFFAGTVAVRLMGVRFLHHLASRRNPRVPVAIYGAGAAGIQLASALRETHQVEPVIFVDDNADLHGIIVAGLKVRPPSKLQQLANTGRISRVILAIPSAPRARQQELLAQLAELSCDVQVLPSFVDLLAGKDVTDSLRPVTPDELLGREKVNLDTPEVAKAYAGRSVMVTGAGGSIGAELCRQLLNCNPRHIVLFERSEFALYEIDMALRPLAAAAGITMTTRLGSVTDRPRVEEVIDEEAVEIILHAAAYKHVPLVEDNVLEGARNNVLGTQIVADVARSRGLERFILISTDKAVRPTNIMGATKRLAERVIQEMQVRANGTRFAMVRF